MQLLLIRSTFVMFFNSITLERYHKTAAHEVKLSRLLKSS
jgi:hypothetical protein